MYCAIFFFEEESSENGDGDPNSSAAQEMEDDDINMLRENNDMDLSSYLESVFVQERDDSESDFSEGSSNEFHIP